MADQTELETKTTETQPVKKGKVKHNLLKFSTWLTGIIVSLMMGFAMVNKYIIVPHVPILVVIIAGWAVIVTTVLNVVLAFFKK